MLGRGPRSPPAPYATDPNPKCGQSDLIDTNPYLNANPNLKLVYGILMAFTALRWCELRTLNSSLAYLYNFLMTERFPGVPNLTNQEQYILKHQFYP